MNTDSTKTVKTLVAFYSQTGNTERIAQAIFRSIKGEKQLMKMSDVTDTGEYDLLFIGFPIINFEPARQAKEFMANFVKGKSVALFTTMSLTAAPVSEQTKDLYNLTISNCIKCTVGSTLLGMFDCPGELSEPTANALLRSPDPMLQMFGALRGITIGFPNEKNISDAGKFGFEIFEKLYVSQSQGCPA